MAHDIFISYSNKNETTANAICNVLETNGIRCWISNRDCQPGKYYPDEILNAIKNCKIFVLVYSRHIKYSKDVLKEVQLAFEYEKIIIPYRIENIDLEEYKYNLAGTHWIDAYPNHQKHYVKLCKTVKTHLELPEKTENKKNVELKKIKNILILIMGIIILISLFRMFLKQCIIEPPNNIAPDKPTTKIENDTVLTLYKLTSKTEEGAVVTVREYKYSNMNPEIVEQEMLSDIEEEKQQPKLGKSYILEVTTQKHGKPKTKILHTTNLDEFNGIKIIDVTKPVDININDMGRKDPPNMENLNIK